MMISIATFKKIEGIIFGRYLCVNSVNCEKVEGFRIKIELYIRGTNAYQADEYCNGTPMPERDPSSQKT